MTKKISLAKPIAAAGATASLLLARAVLAIDTGLNATANAAGLSSGAAPPRLASIIGTLISSLLGFIGVLFIVLMIYAGFTWMTAGGDTEKLKKARGLMTNAVIGAVLVMASYAIASFVIERIIGATTTE